MRYKARRGNVEESMRTRRSLVAAAVVTTCFLSACGGGEGDSTDSGTCSTLKIAGGYECYEPSSSLAVVSVRGGYCSGTFITTRHVLTAAHCFSGGTSGIQVLNQYFSYGVADIKIHPAFNPSSPSDQNDVAVVTINSSAPVSPVPLRLSSPTRAGESVVTYGYGLDQDDETYIDRVENGEAGLKSTPLDVIEVSDFAVQSISDGTGDTCRGDSGGSLLANGNNGQPGIVALVRAGPLPCQAEGGASDNTNVQAASVLNFIRSAAPGVATN